MSIIESYDPDRNAIVKPEFFAPPQEGFPRVAVVTFHRDIAALAPAKLGGEILYQLAAGPVYKVRYRGVDIAIYQTFIGAAGTVGLAEEVHSLGAERFVVFGSCGALDRELTAGHWIIPTAAYRDEGTSYHYVPAADWIDVPTAGKTADIMAELGLPFVEGKTWTTDAIFRETRRNVDARREAGCITVEMECAALMAAAQHRGFEVYQLLYAADNLDCEVWDRREKEHGTMDAKEGYLRVALEIAARL